jgi:hypothetical protein
VKPPTFCKSGGFFLAMKVTLGPQPFPVRSTDKPASALSKAAGRAARRGFWLPLLVGAAWMLLWAVAAEWPGAIIAVDTNQHRANVVVPAPQGSRTIEQQFAPRRDGLAEIELLVAAPVGADVPAAGNSLTLHLWDDAGRLVAAEEFDTAGLRHNQPIRLTFSPEPQSSGRMYSLQLRGDMQNEVSVWGYSLDTHARGALAVAGSETRAADLRFVTHYRLTPVTAVTALGNLLRQEGAYMLLALALIMLPGCLILLAPPPQSRLQSLQQGWDPLARLGMALALGLATWPLLWQWFSLAGGRWSGWLLWLFLGVGWGLVLWRLAWPGRQLRIDHLHRTPSRRLNVDRLTLNAFAGNGATGSRWRTAHIVHVFLLILLILALAVRLLAVRDLVFAPWVDSVRHALITAVMTGTGQVISGYRPWLPVDGFPYHYGFHTLSASLALMTEWPLPRLLLVVGQLLNALVPLTVYSGAWFLTRRRPVALLAAFLVALPFFFPAYYVTWGRLTQLTAMLLMPLALAWTWLLVSGSRGWRRHWWLLSLLVAALFLIHVRVFLLYLPFAAVVWLLRGGRNGRYLLASASLSLLLVLPRLFPLLFASRPPGALRITIPGYNAFPIGYLTTGWERPFLGAAAVAALVVVVLALRRRPAAALPLALMMWVATLFVLLAGDRLGLPETWLVNLNSMYITLFLPLALLLATAVDGLWRLLAARHWLLQTVSYAGAGALLAALLLFGVRQQITILNPQTLLARTEDAAALAWLDRHLPPSAYVAVNSWLWLGGTWSGSDGGAWILPLTGRRSTTPPADYGYDSDLFEQVTTFNEQAQAVTDWAAPSAAEWLQQQGVTHIFVGARGGFFDPAALTYNPSLDLLYAHDGAFIFALKIGGD